MMAIESEYLAALRKIARSGDDDFSIDVGGVPIRARYYPGSSSHLVLDTPYAGVRGAGQSDDYRRPAGGLSAPRPMQITLRPEDAADVAAKRAGVAVEAQTGDAAFDSRVFVDTPSAAEVSRAVLADPALRAAVVTILAMRAGPITLDGFDATISVRLHRFSGLSADPRPLLEALATIARTVPEVRASGRHPTDASLGLTILLGVAAVLGLAPVMLALFAALPSRCYVSDGEGVSLSCVEPACCTPATTGAVVGLIAGILVGAIVRHRIRGTSNAHRVRTWAGLFSLVLVLEAAVTLAQLVGAIALR